MMKQGSIIDNRYRLLEYKGNDGERFGEIWLVEDLDRPGSEPEYMVVSNQHFADKYILIRQLGSGGFGEVWKAKDTITGIDVALKIHKDGDSVQATNQIVKEYTRVMGIHHDNLLTPTHVNIVGGRTAFLEMELCRKDLTDTELSEEEVWKLIHDIASGLKRLAENKKWIEKQQRYVDNPIIHQDIKPANILLRSNGMYAISDFGISKRKLSSLTTNETESQEEGSSPMTVPYAAPERFPGGGGLSVLASDIWSLGAMLYEVVEGNLPFAGYGGNSFNAGARTPTITRKDYSDELKQLIYDCMAKAPADRPTAAQLLYYSEKAIAGKDRKVTWPGTPKQLKSDPAKRLSQYKGTPWEKKEKPPQKHTDWEKLLLWIKQSKKSLIVIPTICTIVFGCIVALPHITELFNSAERKAWRTAKQDNTLESYKAFIESYSKSRYTKEALTKIIRLDNASNNLEGFHYIMFSAEDAVNNISDVYDINVYSGIIEELQDSIRSALHSYQNESNSLYDRATNYSYDHYYSDSSELNQLKMLVDDAISLNDKWNDINTALGNGSAKISIPQWEQYNESIIAALHTIQESFLKGIEELKQWRDNTTDEYKPYYQEAIETVERFCKETGE